MPVVTTKYTKIVRTGYGDPQVTTTTTVSDGFGQGIDLGGGGGAAASGGRYSTPRSDYVRQQRGEIVDPNARGNSPSRAKPVGRGGLAGTSQAYDTLKAELLHHKALFEDPEFPANDTSLYFKERPSMRLEWKRPHEIVKNPDFLVEGASRFDVRQGQLGDCWLLAAIASMSLHAELFQRVVPIDQNFTDNYCGLYRFKFWRFGEWKEVVVDDRLPTYRGELVYMHSTEKNEFWSALLEKAYAKLVGSYEALRGGTQCEAMEDFTGGVTELFDLKDAAPKDLFDIISKAHTRASLMGCSINADPREIEARMSNGLIKGHAYSVTGVKLVNINIPGKSGKIQLVRIRNPWGNEEEWRGSWGDKSPEWQYISETDRQSMGLTFNDDGEFWMSFQDFVKNFEKLEICHLGPQSMTGEELCGSRRWEMCIENGQWKRKLNAGGCRNYINTFWTNPQFRVTVVDADEGDDDNRGTIIVGLMQKNMRKKHLDFLTIGYAIYRLNDASCGPLDMKFFKSNTSIAKSPAFINMREVCGRHRLVPGAYAIVPSTFEPDQEADFLLRIFSEKPNESKELDETTEMDDVKAPEKPGAQDLKQMEALKAAFVSIAGEDMEIDAYELRNILDTAFKKELILEGLKEFKFDGFSLETARSMVAMMDIDQSGKLGFEEFKTLWNDLRLWKTVFKKFDNDKSGNFNSYELRQALNSVGFRVSNAVFNSLVMRYSSKEGVILFDDYILVCARLKTIFETFKAQKHTVQGDAIFDKDTFIQCIMYA